MNGADQDDICTRLAKRLYTVYTGSPPTMDEEDLIDQGRQIAHEAMFKAAFEGCVAKRCCHPENLP